MPNPVVHFEIHSSNAKRLNKYYADLFGWHVNADNPMGYGTVETHAGKGYRHGIMEAQEGAPNMVTFSLYVESDDIQASLYKTVELGGKVFMSVTEVSIVTFALFSDPEGNVIRLVNAGSG
jgi:predicted enzyme related to lactoylglutathione lyase